MTASSSWVGSTNPVAAAEPIHYFEGCLPIEETARRGRDTLRFGPMKPVGLNNPRTGRMPYAVVQLVGTRPGARTMALDAVSHRIYLPSAKLLLKATGETRAKYEPGTFVILVVGQ